MANAVLVGVVTDLGRATMAKAFGNVAGFPFTRAAYFQIGEGGFVAGPGGNVPKVPNPAYTALEATGAPGDIYFQKNLVAANFQFLAPSTMQVQCVLETNEANDDGNGNAPVFYEIGLFDDNGNMLVYGTFGAASKTPTKVFEALVQVYF